MTNEQLIRQYYDGDEAALEKLYHKNIGLIRGIAKESAEAFNCLIKKYLFGRRGRCRRQHARRQDQKNGQTKSKHPFHGVLSLPYFTEYQYNEAAV